MRIGIIGHFGGNEEFNDGQTVKIKNLYNGLDRAIGENIKLDKVDTYYLSKNKVLLLFQLCKCLILDKKIIFLPASRGRKILMRFMYYVGKYLKKDIYHSCIGGGLVRDTKNNPSWVGYLNSYKVNWMESLQLVNGLRELGVRNAEYLPNFKHIEVSETKFKYVGKPIRFCTFSRVSEMKGIEEAVLAICKINDIYGAETALLDIYGPVQPGEEEWFKSLSQKFGESCRYCGVIDALSSVSVLENYVALLFPTRYRTEGMPGTIIDAMFAGVPVISRRWDSCDQMLKDEYNGLVYEFDNPELLFNCIEKVVLNPMDFVKMREICKIESVKYSEETVISTILKEMGVAKFGRK